MFGFTATETTRPPVDPATMRLRRFGTELPDLAVDFASPSLPDVTTDVLTCLMQDDRGGAITREEIWRLPVSTRNAFLLAGANQVNPRPFSFTLHCTEPTCQQPTELELELGEILAFWQPNASDPLRVTVDGRTFRLRRPTGIDQLAWQRIPVADIAQARLAILASLLLEPLEADLSPRLVDTLDTALSEMDPLTSFSLQAVCPFCGTTDTYEISLAMCALRILRSVQLNLIEEIHVLATSYGWTETESLTVPTWRREKYLALIEKRGGR
jgi:hypothetical protein